MYKPPASLYNTPMEKQTHIENKGEGLISFVESGRYKELDLSCSETMLYGTNEAYSLGLPHQALKLSAGFAGGMGMESTCGVITGAVMSLSALFVKNVAHESDYIKGLTTEFTERFLSELGSPECRLIKEKHRHPEEGCKKVILVGAKILAEIIDREKKKEGEIP